MQEKKYICEYCGKQCKNGQSLGGHVVNCNNNPKKQLFHIKAGISNKAKKVLHYVQCKKCGVIFLLELTPKALASGKYTKYCSRSCANSRQHSEQIKKKISYSLNKFHNFEVKQLKIICKQCGCEFSWMHKRKSQKQREFCSRICAGLYVSRFIDSSALIKLSYKNGKKLGGHCRAKWLDYKGIKVQGTYQYKTCQILDNWKKIHKIYDWDYTNDRIPYVWNDGSDHIYNPDFKVFNSKEDWYYLQTKGYQQQKDVLKWTQTINQGYKLQVWFGKQIKLYYSDIK